MQRELVWLASASLGIAAKGEAMYQVAYFIESNATRCPDKLAVCFGDRTLTWKELNVEANKLAFGLMNRGVGKGDVVAYLMRNCIDLVVSWWAIQKLGAVALPLNTFLHENELARTVALSGCKTLIYQNSNEFIQRVESVARATEGLDVIFSGDASRRRGAIGISLDEVLVGEGAINCRSDVGEDDGSLLLFTSGTTGVAKGVMRSQRVVRDYALMMAVENRNASRNDVLVTACPMFHTAGMSLLMKMAALSGTLVFTDGFDAKKILNLICDYKATQVLLVPPSLYMKLGEANDGTADLSSIREAQCSGGRVSPANLAAMHDLFPNASFRFSWGSTETCAPTSAVIPYGEFGRRPELSGTVGMLNSMVELRIVDDLGRDVAKGETGEALVRSSMVFSEYLGNRALSEAVLDCDGWYHTGDMLREDEEGYFYLMDRKSDMIKTGGENVYAQEVERALLAYPGMRECAVIGVPDPYYVEAVALVAVIDGDAPLDEGALVEYCRKVLPGYKKPRYIAYVDSLPRNSIGKLQKSKLRLMPIEKFKKLV